MKYLYQFMATITVTTVISVLVGDAILSVVDQKLQPLIEILESNRPLPAQSSEPLRPAQPAPEDYI
jgi:uncharacterized membrane protein YvlD (DUF360 family)